MEPLHVDVHVYSSTHEIEAKLDLILRRLEEMANQLDTLTAQVAATRTVVDSAVVLINGIAARITAAGVDPTALNALVTDLKSSTDSLSAAVVANTPAVTPPATF